MLLCFRHRCVVIRDRGQREKRYNNRSDKIKRMRNIINDKQREISRIIIS